MIPGLDPAIEERAGLTAKEAEALSLWSPDADKSGGGYMSVAIALDIGKSTARDRVQRGLRKLERAMREPDPASPARVASPARSEPSTGVQVFAER
jgi:hypothetical protein